MRYYNIENSSANFLLDIKLYSLKMIQKYSEFNYIRYYDFMLS